MRFHGLATEPGLAGCCGWACEGGYERVFIAKEAGNSKKKSGAWEKKSGSWLSVRMETMYAGR